MYNFDLKEQQKFGTWKFEAILGGSILGVKSERSWNVVERGHGSSGNFRVWYHCVEQIVECQKIATEDKRRPVVSSVRTRFAYYSIR